MRAASHTAPGTGEAGAVSFDDKVRFLSNPANYPDQPTRVSLRETHHAWLFMTDRHVFKMKKPFRMGGFDFSSLESRQWLCSEELRLNRRLAKNTYLGVVALVLNDRGEMELDAEGCVLEWLVKMVRLADSQNLLVAASQGRAAPEEIRKLMRKLRRFYSDAERVDLPADRYLTHLRDELEFWSQELRRSQSSLAGTSIDDLLLQQLSCLDLHSGLLETRAVDGHIRDAHGDLRPEHVFLLENAEPEIIDCLEFDPSLRRLDSAQEIAFLAMECRHEGFAWLARECFDCYRAEFGSAAAPDHLWNFYASLGATVRAGLSAWRIPVTPPEEQWRRRTVRYFDDAVHHIKLARD